MLLRIALVISCAAAWSTPRRHPARRAVVAASATDPFRPARGSIAPVAINALSAALDGPADAAHIREVVAGAVARRAGSSAAADADGAFTPDEIAALETALTGVLSSRDELVASLLKAVDAAPWVAQCVRASRRARARARQRAKEGPPPRAARVPHPAERARRRAARAPPRAPGLTSSISLGCRSRSRTRSRACAAPSACSRCTSCAAARAARRCRSTSSTRRSSACFETRTIRTAPRARPSFRSRGGAR